MERHYILDDAGQPMPCGMMEWARWLQNNHRQRQIARDEIGGITISTVFLGLDHSFSGMGPPLIFETMIFGGEHDQEMWRYSTRSEAEAGHRNAIDLVNGKQPE